MNMIAFIIYPVLAGFIINVTGRKLLGDNNTTFVAGLAMAAAVGVGLVAGMHN